MEDKILKLLVEQDEVTWKDIIYDLIRSNEMDPWDIDMSKLTKKYIKIVRGLKKFDFKVSGKVLLAASLLLSIKSKKLLEEDILYLDQLIAQKDQMTEEEFYEELESGEYRDPASISDEERKQLIPRTPQPRKRKVSIYDLVGALEKALEVKKRRIMRNLPDMDITLPEKKRDITTMIKSIYKSILSTLQVNKQGHMGFSELLSEKATKEEKIQTFIPLLHLTNERKIDLHQGEHFGEIGIQLIDTTKIKGKN